MDAASEGGRDLISHPWFMGMADPCALLSMSHDGYKAPASWDQVKARGKPESSAGGSPLLQLGKVSWAEGISSGNVCISRIHPPRQGTHPAAACTQEAPLQGWELCWFPC